MGDLGGSDLRRHRLGVEEVRGDEGRQTRSEGVLLARNDRGVRNRQPERVAEQRGDGEPVGDRADHRGLRGAGDEPPDAGVVGEEVGGEEDERGKDEQRERERAHLLQPARALLILRRELGRTAVSAAGAETRYGWCLLDRHRYPLLHDFSETRPLYTHPQAGSHLGVLHRPCQNVVATAQPTGATGGYASPARVRGERGDATATVRDAPPLTPTTRTLRHCAHRLGRCHAAQVRHVE